MEKRRLGTTDIHITPIKMGTWQAGQKQWVGIEDEESIKAIRAAVDAGITTIDTAEVYGNGHSEQVIAQALNDVPRDHIVYATKVFANHLKHDQVLEACDRSLKNLKIDYIDLYQIHWPSGAFNTEIVPIEETMSALNQLKQQGKIRAVGVSNFSRTQLEEAAQYGRIDSIQPPYSLFWRWVEKDVMPYCVENNISILAYSPLAQGLLTGKFGRGHKFAPQDNRAKNKLFQGENYERAQQALEKLRPIAERHQASLASLAIAWLIAQPQTQAIVGARTAEQAMGNAKAVTVQLSTEELAEIDAISRMVTDHLDENPVMWNW
ncbi:aldo/keto reductase [Gloeocapsopsis dulcis]|uniref:Aldo/keto reductase n=1 Tax=Gloeocapsopsis dulcis AAB1 = 1H9 TaxID=1433147 RepID=A0A6N8FZL4_9CHRO|nr:aldo/keto reductase [Gloeocapsopsis dulcis]MUL38174.1 aldo/keto reductase [Gloeocapsopsis dulcis AAB1 = 1H9]WNN90792.1 aldo/keto reductase [Gloeocapsopsis dulcis]